MKDFSKFSKFLLLETCYCYLQAVILECCSGIMEVALSVKWKKWSNPTLTDKETPQWLSEHRQRLAGGWWASNSESCICWYFISSQRQTSKAPFYRQNTLLSRHSKSSFYGSLPWSKISKRANKNRHNRYFNLPWPIHN